LKQTVEALQFQIEKHVQNAKAFKGKPSGEDSRQMAQFLLELLAFRKLYADWKEQIDVKVAKDILTKAKI
jgi:hypothetical protein